MFHKMPYYIDMSIRENLLCVNSAGDIVDETNVQSIRPADGLVPKHLTEVLGRRFIADVPRGTALQWGVLGSE